MQYAESAEFLWRLAKVTHLYGIVVQNRGDMEKRKMLAFEGMIFIKITSYVF